MGTRAAAFTAKIRNLQDYHVRITNCIMPLPTGFDIANTLKHFSQTLLVVLKDVPDFPLELLKSRASDAARLQLFPNLDYKDLFGVVVQLIDSASLIQIGIQAFGQAVLQTIACLLPFLDFESISTLPYIVAASLGTFPCSLHQEIIDLLCHYLLPFSLYNCHESNDKANYASQSVAAILMMVLQHTTSPEFHSQLMECIMSLKRDAVKDVFCVIAYGTLEAKNVAINLLVYYWPHLNSTLYDRRSIDFKFKGWKTPTCKSEMCSINNAGGCADAVKICLDHSIGVALSPENAPPLFLCQECANRLTNDQPDAAEHLYDVLRPIQQVKITCENTNCKSDAHRKTALTICFSAECASYNGVRPIRYCSQCHSIRHNNRRGLDHVFHHCLESPLKGDNLLLNYEVEAIVSLLLEAEPLSTRGGVRDAVDQQTRLRLFTDAEFTDPLPLEERRLMGRYGIWLLVGFFNPEDNIPKDVLGRLLSALFQWFNTTAYLGDDPIANALERLKTDVVCPWIRQVIKTNFETFVSCLLPHPPEFARVGGHWDVISSRTYHLREGFNRIFCLVPYEVINVEIWSQIMPNWMEAVATEVPEDEMAELKSILSKVMDPEMNPLGFEARQMYQFISVRFHQTSHKVKEQALRWLQVLSKLEIVIPLYFIFSIFREGIRLNKIEKVSKRGSVSTETGRDVISAICQDDSRNPSSLSDDEESITVQAEKQSDSELMLSSFIFMLDITLKQLELQEVEQHKGLQTLVAKDAMVLLHNMVAMPWPGKHTCQRETECQFCEMSVLWYQLALEIVQKLAPENPAVEPDIIVSPDGEFGSKLFPETDKKLDVKADNKPSVSPKETMSLEGIIVNMPQILTATVETVSELDLAPIMPSEKIMKAVARSITITESDTASATAHIAAATLVDEEGEASSSSCRTEESGKDFWTTSVGKFKFSIEELPASLQFTYQLLKKIPDEEDSEVLYHLLKCLKILFIHGEVMVKATKEHRGFLIWCQENLLIKNLWELMDAEYSQICEQAVPILLHCVTLPAGGEAFWKQIEEEFHNPDWRSRFTAVERVITITRFMDTHPIRSSQALQSALANAFCYTISALDDAHVAVAQRTALYLGTIHDSAIQSLHYCLETQFDTTVIDRPLILQSLYLLLNAVSDRKILRWDFFLNCFDTLYIEAQIFLDRSGEVAFLKDFKNVEGNTEYFLRKLGRVQEGIAKCEQSQTGQKTLFSSVGTKWSYKRTMSAPIIFPKQTDREKLYSRQASAPILKRKGSRHGLECHMHGLVSNEECHMANLYHRIVELEETDKDTIHLLVFLFMQFLSKYSRGPIPSESKPLAKTQTAVLKHIAMLMGYNSNDKIFFLPPSRIRTSPVFNSYMANLPQVLDQNFKVGATIIPLSLTVMHYTPAPNKSQGLRPHPLYSLWYLEPHVRRYWLTSLVVILYKYEYGILPLSAQVQTVVRIILNTLNGQEHQCRPLPTNIMMEDPSTRSRDMSQATLNLGDLSDPDMAGNISGGLIREPKKSSSSITSIRQRKPGMVESSLEFMSSVDSTDNEPELAVIPESPGRSDSTGELGSFRDLVFMDKPEVVSVQAHQVKSGFEELGKAEEVHAFQKGTPVDAGKVAETLAVVQESKAKGGLWFGGGSEGSESKSSSTGSSISTSKSSKGGDFPWHLSVQAAFQIAKIPAAERLLPVGFNPPPPSPTTRSRGQASANPYESPDSPMSRMDMISIGPTVRIDDEGPISPEQANITSYSLERPAVERLLSLGQDEKQADATVSGRLSPKKLVKQPHVVDGDSAFETAKSDPTGKKSDAQETSKSVGFTSANTEIRHHILAGLRQSSIRIGDNCVQDRCSDCGAIIESFSNEELGLCIVAIETFIHKEPALAAPLMPEIIKAVSKIAVKPLYPFQAESNTYLPGGVSSVAHQFLRCVLHQLAPYGIFNQLFQTKFSDRVKVEVFKAISYALADFVDLNPVAPLQLLFESLVAKKTLAMDTMVPIINNVAAYLECLPIEAALPIWSTVLPSCDAFLRKILPSLSSLDCMDGLIRMMINLLRIPGLSASKSILDPFSKVLSFAIQNYDLKYGSMLELCHLCHRVFTRDREKLVLTRVAVYELIQALKFKTDIPDNNLLLLLTLILQDSSGSVIAPFVYVEGFPRFHGGDPPSVPSTGACESMKQHITDSIEFLADFHSLSKIKNNYKGTAFGLNEDVLGGIVKGGISQFLALEISKGNSNPRENRGIARYLPWLYNTLSSIQQGPKEFLDCVSHIRVLSWLLLGSLTHTAIFGTHAIPCTPIPLEASCHVADHVHVILTGFAEQSKASVLHMSSLFYAFILCQVWTIYLEEIGPTFQPQNSGQHQDPHNTSTNMLMDFWGKVTPAILQLISHSKVLAEMVNLHFLTLMESLLECNSSVFNRLLPLWSPVLHAHSGTLAGHINVRMQNCLSYPPPDPGITFTDASPKKVTGINREQIGGIDLSESLCGPVYSILLLKWVQRLQFKMSQIELQSSAATQFYPM